MRPLLSILFTMFVALSMSASTLTVTIDSRTSASLTCNPVADMPNHIAVQYENTGSKGQLTAGDVAVLTLSGLPKGTISQMTLFMHSNTKSGSATVSVTIGKQSWQVVSGAFVNWPGVYEYTTTDQPIVCLRQPLSIYSDDSIQVNIRGLVNSVYLQRMEVEFIEAPQEPHTVTFHWFDSVGWHIRETTEQQPLAGILLPEIDTNSNTFTYEAETWNWLGWMTYQVDANASIPDYLEAGERFFPTEDCHLYALYANAIPQTILPDTSFACGEYAMVRVNDIKGSYVMYGCWQQERIALQPVHLLSNLPNSCAWTLISLGKEFRYELSFVGDSLSIRNKSTNVWIGHSAKTPNKTCTKWAWHRAENGSIFICSNLEWMEISYPNYYSSYYVGMSLSFEPNDLDTPYIAFQKETYLPNYVYWLLFPVQNIPEHVSITYTTFYSQSSVPNIQQRNDRPLKVLFPDGTVRIRYNNQTYNLRGNSL